MAQRVKVPTTKPGVSWTPGPQGKSKLPSKLCDCTHAGTCKAKQSRSQRSGRTCPLTGSGEETKSTQTTTLHHSGIPALVQKQMSDLVAFFCTIGLRLYAIKYTLKNFTYTTSLYSLSHEPNFVLLFVTAL